MKVVKNINNNVALCLDNYNNEIVAFGKGIGFSKPPYEISLSQIERTYYNIDPVYISMINEIPKEVLDISDQVINYARLKLENPISSNIVFTLADHINFAIRRYKENMNIKLPVIYDIQYLLEVEMDIGFFALKLIQKDMHVFLPKEEAAYIALHIMNAESAQKDRKEKLDEDIIEDIVEIIEYNFEIHINKNGFNYFRFVTHMYYLIKRGKKNELIQSENSKMFQSLTLEYPATYKCMEEIRKYLKTSLDWELTDEECIYLMLHINRLCIREDYS